MISAILGAPLSTIYHDSYFKAVSKTLRNVLSYVNSMGLIFWDKKSDCHEAFVTIIMKF